MAPSLRITLLGQFSASIDSKRVVALHKSRRLQSLLATLVLQADTPLSRNLLASQFWPASIESQARTNLRKLLYQLKTSLPEFEHYVQIEADTLQWRSNSNYHLDVEALESLLAFDKQSDPDETLLQQVSQRYAGELLADLNDEWIIQHRAMLHQHVITNMTAAAQQFEANAKYLQAAAIIDWLLTLDSLDEAHYRKRMRLSALAHNKAGALAAYEACRTMLQQEYAVTPSAKTESLLRHIVAGDELAKAEKREQAGNQSKTHLIGRKTEWAQARARLDRLRQTRTHCVMLYGEAGIGKTRLAEELLTGAALDGFAVVRARAYALHDDLAYAPIAGLMRTQHATQRIKSLSTAWQIEISRLLPDLLSNSPTLAEPLSLSQPGQQQRFFEALAHTILSPSQTTLLLFDDLQWCDAKTLEWLHYLICIGQQGRLLLVGTYRDDEIGTDHPLRLMLESLRHADKVTSIGLQPLAPAAVTDLALSMTGKKLNSAETSTLFEETAGIPLFVVETLRARLPQNDAPPTAHKQSTDAAQRVALPPKIYAHIQYRLGRLTADAQQVVHLAATIGRTFDYQLLHAIYPMPQATTDDLLSELLDKRVIEERGAGRFNFYHDKIRDVALAEHNYIQKRRLNRQIAEAIEQTYATRLDEFVGALALHYELAGDPLKAIGYLQQAATLDQQRGSFPGAREYLTKALALLALLPGDETQQRHELAIQLRLANVQTVIKRLSGSTVETAYQRALHLSQELHDDAAQFQALFGLMQHHMIHGDLGQSRAFCKQCVAFAEQTEVEEYLLAANLFDGFLAYFQGDLHQCLDKMRWVCATFDFDDHAKVANRYTQDPGVHAHLILGLAEWHSGNTAQGTSHMNRAGDLAAVLKHPVSQALVCYYNMLGAFYGQDDASGAQYAEQLLVMADKYAINFTLVNGRLGRDFAATMLDIVDEQAEASFASFKQQFALYRQEVSSLSLPFHWALLARSCIKLERYEDAQDALDQGLQRVESSGERFFESEIYRLQGVLQQLQNAQQAAETNFAKAVETAGEQNFKMLELRATITLCRLFMQQGKREQALETLQAAYSQFEPESESLDIDEARTLLAAWQ